jgi:3-oxoacyl-[acyl-carrier protein] reductase
MPESRGHALVTGASAGIGSAIADRLLRDGWQVTGVSRRKDARAAPAFRSIAADLATAEGCAVVLADVSGVTAFVHCAGHLTTGVLGELDATASERLWRLHVRAAEHIANALAPGMPRGGRLVLIGSRTSAGSPGRSQYAAAKAAMVAMTRSWALELAPRGITSNVIAPAATATAMLSDPSRSAVAPRMPPIGRYITPDEVAAAAAFLLSHEADAITGQVITICGGASL